MKKSDQEWAEAMQAALGGPPPAALRARDFWWLLLLGAVLYLSCGTDAFS